MPKFEIRQSDRVLFFVVADGDWVCGSVWQRGEEVFSAEYRERGDGVDGYNGRHHLGAYQTAQEALVVIVNKVVEEG